MLYNKTERISFPLGGIGTGCIGLAGNGETIFFDSVKIKSTLIIKTQKAN